MVVVWILVCLMLCASWLVTYLEFITTSYGIAFESKALVDNWKCIKISNHISILCYFEVKRKDNTLVFTVINLWVYVLTWNKCSIKEKYFTKLNTLFFPCFVSFIWFYLCTKLTNPLLSTTENKDYEINFTNVVYY